MMITLHNRLCSAKSPEDDVKFSGVNIVFLDDFLQLPSLVSIRARRDINSAIISSDPSMTSSYCRHRCNRLEIDNTRISFIVVILCTRTSLQIDNTQISFIIYEHVDPRKTSSNYSTRA